MSATNKLTRQGVRDLNHLGVKIEPRTLPIDCNHTAMDVCCYVIAMNGPKKGRSIPCGHWICRKCGCSYDESFDGSTTWIRR